MKNIKKLIQICFVLVAVFSVVALTKTDAKAAGQITGLKQTSATSSSVSIAWDTVAGSNHEKVYYRVKGSNAAWQVIKSTYNIVNLMPGTSYEVRVELYSDYEYSQLVASTPTPIEVVTAPGEDASFAIKQKKASASSATVSWSAYAGANCYKLKYRTSGRNNERTTLVTGTSKKLTGLTKNKDTDIAVIPCRVSDTGFVADSINSKSLRVSVVPSKPGVKYTNISKKKLYIKLASNCDDYADGYEYDIYRVKGNKRIKKVKPKSDASYCEYSNKAFTKRDLFKVRVCSYKKAADGKKYYTGWSSWNYFYTVGPINAKSNPLNIVRRNGIRGIQVKWNKINGASGYKVYASTKNDPKKYKVVATVKKGSITSATFYKLNKKALRSGKRYYVYVAPYYKSGKKTYSMKNQYHDICAVEFWSNFG